MPLKPIEVTLSFHMLARLFKGKAVNVNNRVILIPNPTMLNEAEDAEKKCLECDREDSLVERPNVLKVPQINPRKEELFEALGITDALDCLIGDSPKCPYCGFTSMIYHFGMDEHIKLCPFRPSPKQPQYREPTAEDAGKMVEVNRESTDGWFLTRKLLAVLPNNCYPKFICEVGPNMWMQFHDARIKVEE